MKTEGALRDRVAAWISKTWMATMGLYALATIATIFIAPFLFAGVLKNPLFWVVFLLLLAAGMLIPVAAKAQKFGRAFIASSVLIACMIGLSALSLFPRLVPSSTDINFSLTIYNASSSQMTLSTMLVIALIGVPLVLIYTILIYRVFKGKVVLTGDSY
jgi:cytochrome d ubiquinol oxidase subunit II